MKVKLFLCSNIAIHIVDNSVEKLFLLSLINNCYDDFIRLIVLYFNFIFNNLIDYNP